MESKVRLLNLDNNIQKGGAIQSDKAYYTKISNAIQAAKLQSDLNREKIEMLKNQVEEIVNSSVLDDGVNDMKAEDLIDELMEVRDMFTDTNYEALKENILSLKRAIQLMLRADIGTGILSPEEISLLEEISENSKPGAKDLLKENFSQLVGIFTKLKPELNNNYEGDESEEEDNQEDLSEENTSEDENKNSENGSNDEASLSSSLDNSEDSDES